MGLGKGGNKVKILSVNTVSILLRLKLFRLSHTIGTAGQEGHYHSIGHDPKYLKEGLLPYNAGRQESI